MRARSTTSQPMTVRTLRRGLEVLEAIAADADDGGVGLSDIAAAVGIDKATASRMAQTLCAMGYVSQAEGSKRYWLTGKLLALGAGYRRGLNLPARAAPHLATLREQTGETVHLGVREGDRVVYIAKLETQRPVQIASAVGQSMPLHTTALGKSLLATLPVQQLDLVIERMDLTRRTDRSIVDAAALRAELDETRRRGYSIDDRENEEAITCVGAPIVNGLAEVVGAISVSGPSYRMEQHIAEYGARCRASAAAIGAIL